jgi:acyl-CoA thioesterase
MQHFIPLQRIDDNRYTLQVTEEVCVGPVGHAFMFGGAGLGAAVRAVEMSLGRSLVCATMQFVSFAKLGDCLDIDVSISQAGRTIAQTLVTGRAEGRLVFSATAALGGRDDGPDHQWTKMPTIAPPGASRGEDFV